MDDAQAWQRVLDASADAMLVADGRGRIVAANAAAAGLFDGSDAGRLLALGLDDLLPEPSERLRRALCTALEDGPGPRPPAARLELRARRAGGDAFDAELRLGALGADRVLVGVVDATQRRRDAEALRKFSRVIEQTASSVVVTDRDGVIEYVNPRFTEVSGYAAAEAVGRRPSLLKSGHTDAAVYAALWRRIRGGDTWQGEFRNRRKDGSLYWEAAIVSPVRDEHGEITHYVSIQDDITERKAAEAALRERQIQLRLFVEHAPVALAMFDREMRYLAVSRRWLADYRLEGRTIVGRSHYEIFPEIPEHWRAIHRRGLAGAAERVDEERFERADGSVQWLRWEVMPWRVDDAVGGLMIFTEDITDRKRAQLALAASEQRFRATFEQAAVGFAHVAPDGRWLRVNEKLCRIVGYTRDELTARTFQDITHPEDLEADLEQLRRLLAGEIANYAIDKRYLRKDGTPVWIRLTGSLVRRADGTPDYFIAVVEDVDERKRSEDALRRMRGEMDQLLALHVAIQTAAAIAHELNQPLNAVTAYAEAALRLAEAGPPKAARLRRALDGAAQQAQRAGRVVRELLAFLNKSETQPEVIDLNAVVQEALALVESKGFGGFRCDVRLAADLRPVLANRLQTEKVLVNLVRNGVEAMRAAGIAMQSIVIAVRTDADATMARVSVTDTGPGLDAATAERVFEPFFSTKPGGIGMGLAVSRALIEANGGRLWVDPVPGAGATFHFTLPFAP